MISPRDCCRQGGFCGCGGGYCAYEAERGKSGLPPPTMAAPMMPSVKPPAVTFPRDAHAFPVSTIDNYTNHGITAQMYAAIRLCVPDSGVDWLDAMIRRKQRDDLAAKAILCAEFEYLSDEEHARRVYQLADAIQRAGDQDFAEVKKSGA